VSGQQRLVLVTHIGDGTGSGTIGRGRLFWQRPSAPLRWSKAGVLDRVFSEWRHTQLLQVRIECLSLDSIIVKVHPDGIGVLKK